MEGALIFMGRGGPSSGARIHADLPVRPETHRLARLEPDEVYEDVRSTLFRVSQLLRNTALHDTHEALQGLLRTLPDHPIALLDDDVWKGRLSAVVSRAAQQIGSLTGGAEDDRELLEYMVDALRERAEFLAAVSIADLPTQRSFTVTVTGAREDVENARDRASAAARAALTDEQQRLGGEYDYRRGRVIDPFFGIGESVLLPPVPDGRPPVRPPR